MCKISSVELKESINKLVVKIRPSMSIAILTQLPKNYIIYGEENSICIQIPI